MCGEEFFFCIDLGSLGWLVLSHLLAVFVGLCVAGG